MAYKKGKTGRTVALVLCSILSLAAVAGAGTALYYGASENGWFSKEAVEEDDTVTEENTETAGSLYVGESESTNNNIKLTSVKLLAEEYGEYGISTASVESAYTITVSYNSEATNPTFTWTASPTGSVTITPSADTKSCVVSCSAAFSTQVVITCTADDNSSAKATCTVDYVRRITGATLSFIVGNSIYDPSVSWSGSGSTATWAATEQQVNASADDSGFGIGTSIIYGTGTVDDGYGSSVVISYTSKITNTTYTDATEINDFKTLICNITGVSSTSSNLKSELYNALISYYNSSTAVATFTVTVTGAKTGETYTGTYNLIINPADFYVAVSSVSLDQTTIYF